MVSSTDDFIVVQEGSCHPCTEKLFQTEIQNAWIISKRQTLEGKKHKYFPITKFIKCDCEKPRRIKPVE